MRKYSIKYIAGAVLTVLTVLGHAGAGAQERALVEGLESDSVYIELVGQESRLRLEEDSLNAKVVETRGLFRTDPDNRDRYSQDIIRLEGEIFDTRNRLGVVSGKINNIEQQFIFRNLTQGASPRQRDNRDEYPENSAVLPLNPFFSENLPPEDYKLLVEAQRLEAAVEADIATFAENYAEIREIAAGNEAACDRELADSLYSAYQARKSLNDNLSDRIAQNLAYIYDNKLYCYNYILDKYRRSSQLSRFEQKITRAREYALEAGQGAESAAVASYPHTKSLLLEYETALAEMAGYRRSLDSLRGAERKLAATSFDFPAVEIEEKLFLDFAPVEFHSPARYDARNPVPALAVHPRGEIYRVLLGSFQRSQPVSILKGAYPVGVLQEGGRYNYYAGGFATLGEASDAVEALRKKGFTNPKVARWVNGQYTLLEQAQVERLLGTVTDGLFRLSIDTGGKPLPDVVKEIVEDISPGAEISRSGSLYIIGVFESRREAEEAAEDIRDETEGITVKIEDVG